MQPLPASPQLPKRHPLSPPCRPPRCPRRRTLHRSAVRWKPESGRRAATSGGDHKGRCWFFLRLMHPLVGALLVGARSDVGGRAGARRRGRARWNWLCRWRRYRRRPRSCGRWPAPGAWPGRCACLSTVCSTRPCRRVYGFDVLRTAKGFRHSMRSSSGKGKNPPFDP